MPLVGGNDAVHLHAPQVAIDRRPLVPCIASTVTHRSAVTVLCFAYWLAVNLATST